MHGNNEGEPGDEESNRRIREAAVGLQEIIVRAIARHFPPDQQEDILAIARHVMDDTGNLVNPDCCERARASRRT
jgi:hypothetical protein